jgi:RNA polymerase sigma factor (sigma-70 family)
MHYRDEEDAISVAMLQVCQQIHKFDASRGCRLTTWIWPVVVNKMSSYIQRYHRKNLITDTDLVDHLSVAALPENDELDSKTQIELMRSTMATLPERKQQVLRDYMNGVGIVASSEKIGVSRSRTHQLRVQCLGEMRKLMAAV